MKKYNACISVISSRSKCLPLCLKSLWDKWNYKYDYPNEPHLYSDLELYTKGKNNILCEGEDLIIENIDKKLEILVNVILGLFLFHIILPIMYQKVNYFITDKIFGMLIQEDLPYIEKGIYICVTL